MEYDLILCQHDRLMESAHEFLRAGETLAASLAGSETGIPAPTAYEILTNLMDTLMTMSRATQALRVRLVGSLYGTEIGLTHVDLVMSETRDPVESVLAADADIRSSASSLELAERCLSRARDAIAAQVNEQVNGDPATASRNTP